MIIFKSFQPLTIITKRFQPLTIITKRSILDDAAVLDLPLSYVSSIIFYFIFQGAIGQIGHPGVPGAQGDKVFVKKFLFNAFVSRSLSKS